jgi:DNA-binding NarL/FixJ family response regulator
MKQKILLADDHRLFRDGLRTLLDKQADMEVVGETSDGSQTIAAVSEKKPNIILMDISMPNLNGIDATRRIISENPSIKIIILSMHSDQKFVVEALKSGAVGYLLKDCAIDELIGAIRIVAAGQIYLARDIEDAVIKDYLKLADNRQGSAFTTLSIREREVLQLLAKGLSTKETASKLNISIKTVETHRKQIMDKLGIYSIAELTKYAIREGLTPLD